MTRDQRDLRNQVKPDDDERAEDHPASAQGSTETTLSRLFLSLLFTFACVVGLSDILASLLRKPMNYSSPESVLLPLAVTTGLAALGYCVFSLLAFTPVPRWLGLDRRSFLLGGAVFWAAVFAAGAIVGLIPPSERPQSMHWSGITLIALGLSCIAFASAAGAVTFWRSCTRPGLQRLASALCLAFPFLLAILLALLMLRFAEPVSVLDSTPVFATIFFLLAIAVLGLFSTSWCQRCASWLGGTLLVLLIAIPIFAATGWLSSPAPAPQGNKHADHVSRIILLTIDTLRKDALSCYGSTRIQTPNIDALAADGIRFDNAIAPSPWTLSSIASIMTGLAPRVHGAVARGGALRGNVQTLAQYFEEAGYTTAGIGRNPHLDSLSNLDRGFRDYHWFPRPRINFSLGGTVLKRLFPERFDIDATTPLTSLASSWTQVHASEDFFLWLHYFDPHVPYTPPRELLQDKPADTTVGWTLPIKQVMAILHRQFSPSTVDREWIRALYEAEVVHVDNSLGRLVSHLKNLDIYDDALIVMTSDHGEEFWEHGGFEHGHTLYQELLNVPLVIKLPGNSVTGVRDQTVSIEDVLPTMLDICGLEYESDNLSGRSLSPLISSGIASWKERPVVSTGILHGEDRESILYENWKYIRFSISSLHELYGLDTDRDEQENLVHSRPDVVSEAQHRLAEDLAVAEHLRGYWGVGDQQNHELNEWQIEALKAIGYW